ncbi:MAG: glutamine cyclotransferase [Mucilaginibacter sp.]|nr:glutamine cyclotransferase [Mucilaginibacter sp.]
MRFGPQPLNTMKNKLPLILIASALLAAGCKNKSSQPEAITISPESGTTFKSGDPVTIKASLPSDIKADSIVYLLDSVKIASKKDTSGLTLKTDTLKLGARLLTVKVYASGKANEISTNIVLLAAKPPEEYTFRVEKVFPHDTSCFTEGLVYQDGFLYESGGGYLDPPPGEVKDGQSSLRKVDLNTGKVVKKVMVDPKVFGEGTSIVGNKIIQLTWKAKIGYVYDKDSFKLLNTFTNNVGIEGWGLCFDGNKLYMDDSTNRIYFLDKNTFRQLGFIEVYDDKKQIDSVNELEYIDGKLYANVWQTNNILVINPKTGAVLQKIDLTNLYPQGKRNGNADVLNGIAYDAQGKRIFVTGKKWDKLFQVKFMKK